MFCSNCGQELAPEAKFCSNCGAPVNSGASSANRDENEKDRRERERREDFERAWGGSSSQESTPDKSPSDTANTPSGDSYSNEQYAGGFATKRPQWEVQREQLRENPDDEWSMSDLGPAKPRRRRTWLWVLLGTMAVIVIACCVFSWWITYTDAGTEWFEGIATQAAEEIQRATEEATPQP